MDRIIYASDALAITEKANPGLFATIQLAAKMGAASITTRVSNEELKLLNHLGYFTETLGEQVEGPTLMYQISWR